MISYLCIYPSKYKKAPFQEPFPDRPIIRRSSVKSSLKPPVSTFFQHNQIVHKKLERECERKACKYKEFERFRSDWGKKNEMYTGLIWFKLGLCDRDKV